MDRHQTRGPAPAPCTSPPAPSPTAVERGGEGRGPSALGGQLLVVPIIGGLVLGAAAAVHRQGAPDSSWEEGVAGRGGVRRGAGRGEAGRAVRAVSDDPSKQVAVEGLVRAGVPPGTTSAAPALPHLEHVLELSNEMESLSYRLL